MLWIEVPKVGARNCYKPFLSLTTAVTDHYPTTCSKGWLLTIIPTVPRYLLASLRWICRSRGKVRLNLLLRAEIAAVWDVILEGDCLYPTGDSKDLNVYKLNHLLSPTQFTCMNSFRTIHPLKAFSTSQRLKPIPRLSQHNARRFASTMEYTRQVERTFQLIWTSKLTVVSD